jgi:hypothetical protein
MVRCTTGGKNGVKVVLCFSNFDAMKCWDDRRHVPDDQNQKKIFQNWKLVSLALCLACFSVKP